MKDLMGMYTRHQLETQKERDHLEGVGIGMRIILICIFKKYILLILYLNQISLLQQGMFSSNHK
jgi:hypothetical protein